MADRVVLSVGDKVYQGSIVTGKVHERAVDGVRELRVNGGETRRRYDLEGFYLRTAIENIVSDSDCGETFWLTAEDAREALRLRWIGHAKECIEYSQQEIERSQKKIAEMEADLAILEAGEIPEGERD